MRNIRKSKMIANVIISAGILTEPYCLVSSNILHILTPAPLQQVQASLPEIFFYGTSQICLM